MVPADSKSKTLCKAATINLNTPMRLEGRVGDVLKNFKETSSHRVGCQQGDPPSAHSSGSELNFS